MCLCGVFLWSYFLLECPFLLKLATNGWRQWQRNALTEISKSSVVYINIFLNNVLIFNAFITKLGFIKLKMYSQYFFSICKCLRCFYMMRNWKEHGLFRFMCRVMPLYLPPCIVGVFWTKQLWGFTDSFGNWIFPWVYFQSMFIRC